MGETTEILWADSTFNGWIGCTEVSVGELGACTPCYARELAKRYGWAEWGNHPRHKTSEANWRKPLAWDRKAAASGEPWFVFSNSLSDVFDNQVPPEWRRDLFDLIRATPHLTWLLLTKRPQNIVKLFNETWETDADGWDFTPPAWPRNAAIGFTAVTQAEIDRDSKHALNAYQALAPAFLFCSGEPLMELMIIPPDLLALGGRFWMITGGMTSQGKFPARPTHPAAFRSLRDQCAAADVPFLFKQWGDWVSVSEVAGAGPHFEFPDGATVRKVGAKKAGHTLDGQIHDARPSPVTRRGR